MTVHSDRLSRLRARMAETGTDLVALGPTSHMRWLAGLDPHGDERPVMLLVSRDFAGVLMPSLNADSARQVTDLPFFTWADATGPEAALADLLAACHATWAPCASARTRPRSTPFAPAPA
jgi:Xaa-Pro dipeptidase